jgi:hypothetical protein
VSFPCFWTLCFLGRAILHCGSSSSQWWPVYSGIPNFPRSRFSWRHSSCTVPLLHDGTPSCRQQQTSFGIHNLLGSVPLALHIILQLASSPCAASSILWLVSLQHLR